MDIPVMRAAMVRIAFSEQAAQALVEEQGIATLEEIRLLSDDEIETLFKVIRHPGGTIAQPGCCWRWSGGSSDSKSWRTGQSKSRYES